MKDKFCVIMAGGAGSRFWPFSRNERPKQFLDFMGTGSSLLQMTYNRFRKIIPAENIYIVSNRIYRDLIMEQLPELPEGNVLLEPTRRNTAPCIAYAMNRIAKVSENANVVVAPSDHLILKEDEFLDTIQQGFDFVSENDALLTLGIKPSRPETGYGYIQISEGDGLLRKVRTFTEKPNQEMAKIFMDSGEFLWNSGIFLWSIPAIRKSFETLLPEMANKFKQGTEVYGTPREQAFIDEIYPLGHNISIDYGIMEKAPNVYVLCSDFGWSDLGTWGSLYDLSPKDENRNVSNRCQAMFYDSKDNIVVMSEDKLAVVQGLEGYIVAESGNALLICKKEEEQHIRQMVNDITVKYDGKYN